MLRKQVDITIKEKPLSYEALLDLVWIFQTMYQIRAVKWHRVDVGDVFVHQLSRNQELFREYNGVWEGSCFRTTFPEKLLQQEVIILDLDPPEYFGETVLQCTVADSMAVPDFDSTLN